MSLLSYILHKVAHKMPSQPENVKMSPKRLRNVSQMSPKCLQMSPKGYTNLKFLTSPLCNSEVFICSNTIYLLLFLVSKAAIISKNNSNNDISEVDAMLFFDFKNKSGFEKIKGLK